MSRYEKIRGMKTLACCVIIQAIKDFTHTYSYGDKNKTRDECFRFLTGKTEISNLWFNMAGIIFFNAKDCDDLMSQIENTYGKKRNAFNKLGWAGYF